MSLPRVTIGVVSFNRLHYLKATLESARECIQYPNLEWIVVDGASVEPGLQEYLRGLSWLDQLVVRNCSHADAMNEIVARASGEFVAIWPEDVQFVARGDWMQDLVEVLEAHRDVGSVVLDFQRKTTIETRLSSSWRQQRGKLMEEIRRYGLRLRRRRTYESSRGLRVYTMGWMAPGVVGSGVPSLTRTRVWRELGPWRAAAAGSGSLVDSSLGAEDDMVARFYASRRALQRGLLERPVAADIITDRTGCKAKVRKGKRYGEYWPPPEGTYYYRIRDCKDYPGNADRWPVSFMEAVEPIGFAIPVDRRGERLKAAFNERVCAPLE